MLKRNEKSSNGQINGGNIFLLCVASRKQKDRKLE